MNSYIPNRKKQSERERKREKMNFNKQHLSKINGMSRQQQRMRENRTYEFWGGRPLKRTTSDLFLDRPKPANTIFSGPNALWTQRYPSRDHIGDIGEGQASALRSLDVGYLTRYVVSISNEF